MFHWGDERPHWLSRKGGSELVAGVRHEVSGLGILDLDRAFQRLQKQGFPAVDQFRQAVAPQEVTAIRLGIDSADQPFLAANNDAHAGDE